ncbi:hypothetical protein QO010_003006 [Caulobacter ginsengisoli]|uniref:DUF4412 domain-containing protein n=1 Tax=Caulobacter ginsengisoli TaxID=400775 RepID=A0ABU0IT91_9CAUL|nr:hypothetical protein [Caulobacter ginsengisoli]MDQ0465219.1 hypothetical protein [Caulobacter ginsengisoli]
MKTVLRLAAFAAVPLLLATGAQAAEKRMVTFDSASPEARQLTGAGLTFVFTKSLLGAPKVLAVRATAVPVGIIPKPSRDGAVNRELDRLMGEDGGRGELFQIDPDAAEGKVMIKAFCPGSTRGWLAVSDLTSHRGLRVYAFGDNPSGGALRICARMDFAFRGEWRMPGVPGIDPTKAVFKADYGYPGS